MAPFLRDEGPPVSKQTIQRARESLPLEYGTQSVNETGREVLLVRVPKAKPDYLNDLADVAFYVDLDAIRDTKDILLIGHEKTARLEPRILRDHIRAQAREDEGVVEGLRRSLDSDYGHTVVQSPSNHHHHALAMRIPKASVASFAPDDVMAFRQILKQRRTDPESCQYAYIVANNDFERLGRRVLLDLLGNATPPEAAPEPEREVDAPAPASAPAPVGAAPVAPAPPAMPPAAAPAPARASYPPARAPPAATAASSPIPMSSPAPSATPAASRRPPSIPNAGGLSGIIATAVADPNPTATPEAIAAAAERDVHVVEHEEYEIITSKPKVAPEPAPEPAPLGATSAMDSEPEAEAEDGSDEYEIMTSKPKPAAAQPPASGPPAATPAPAAATTAPGATAEHADGRKVEKMTDEFEVYTSKPKTPKPDTPAITPPGMGGFQNAFQNAYAPPVPNRTKEYEIMGRPSITSDPSIAAKLRAATAASAAQPAVAPARTAAANAAAVEEARAVRDDPRAVTPRTRLPISTADSGSPFIPTVAPANPEGIFAQRFRDAGYELVEGLRAQGTVFAFAAHRPNGRRVLVKRAETFGVDDAATLIPLVTALGADVAVVIADRILDGTRMATWGTRLEVYDAQEALTLRF